MEQKKRSEANQLIKLWSNQGTWSETRKLKWGEKLCYRPSHFCSVKIVCKQSLTAHNWQKWKRVFLTCPCHDIYRDEAVGIKNCKYTWKITFYVNMWNLIYQKHINKWVMRSPYFGKGVHKFPKVPWQYFVTPGTAALS